MSVIAEVPYTAHVSVGGTTYTFDFRADLATDLEVYVNEVQVSSWSVSGLGNDAGGIVTMHSAVTTGLPVLIRRAMPQTNDLDLYAGGILPAETLEDAFDRVVMLVQDLREILSRIPTLAAYVGTALRNLSFPEPSAGNAKLIGYNANDTGLTLYDPTILSTIPDPISGHVHGKSQATLTATGAHTQLVATALIPAGVKVLGVAYECLVSFSDVNGLTSVDLGGLGVLSGWGQNLGITAGAVNNDGHMRSDEPRTQSAQDVTLTANGGTFGPGGQARLTVFWRRLSLATVTSASQTVHTITASDDVGFTSGFSRVIVSAVNGAGILTAAGLIPAKTKVLAVHYQCLVAFNGAVTSVDLGGLGLVSGWGQNLAVAIDTVNDYGDMRADEPIADNAADVTLTANGGTFGTTGQAQLTVYWRVFNPA